MSLNQQGNRNEAIVSGAHEQSDQASAEFIQIGCSFINNLLTATYQQFIYNEQASIVTPAWFRELNTAYKQDCNKKTNNHPAFFYEAITTILITLTEKFDKDFALQILKKALRSTSLEFPGKTSTLREHLNSRIYE